MAKKKPAKTKVLPWGDVDRSNLADLIRKGKVDIDRPDDINYIKRVHTDHFPHRDERNFIRNFRTVSTSWDTETARNGARKEGTTSHVKLIISFLTPPSDNSSSDVEEEDDTPPTLPNALPDNDDSAMPPKKTTTTTAATAPTATAAKKAPPLSAASMKSLPVPTHNIGANFTYAWTKQYSENKEFRIDLVVYLTGFVQEQESPSVRTENKTTLHIYPQYNKKVLGSNIPSLLGWDENSARSQAFASIGQDLASSQRFRSDAN